MITITRDSAYGIVTIRLDGSMDTDICVHGSISEKEMAEIISDALVKAEPRSKTWGITEITASAATVSKSTGLQGEPMVTVGSDGVTIRHDCGKKRYIVRSPDWGVSWVCQYYHDGELVWESHGETLEQSLDPT